MPLSSRSSVAPARYTIASVSKLTGVSCHVLRAWERRYGFPTPLRSPKGQRRYEPAVVETLREICRQVREGRAVGRLIPEYLAGRLEPREAIAPPAREALDPIEELLQRIALGDVDGARCLLDREEARLDVASFVSRLIQPALVEVGERWYRGDFEIFHERMATSLLLRRLEILLHRAKEANVAPRRRILVCAVQGDRHEGGLRILALALEMIGWRAIVLGADLPVEQLAAAARALSPDAAAVSFALSRNISRRFEELAEIGGTPIFVGGRSMTNYRGLARRAGLIPLSSPVFEIGDEWERELANWRAGRSTNGSADGS